MNGEPLLLIGEIVMGASVLGLVTNLIVFRILRRKLNAELERKYGKRRI